MERLPARFKLALPRIGEQLNAAEVEHIQLTQSLRTTRQSTFRNQFGYRFLRLNRKILRKVSKIVQISTPKGWEFGCRGGVRQGHSIP